MKGAIETCKGDFLEYFLRSAQWPTEDWKGSLRGHLQGLPLVWEYFLMHIHDGTVKQTAKPQNIVIRNSRTKNH